MSVKTFRKKIRVLIIDDSVFFRNMLKDSLNKTDSIEVVATAINAEDGYNKIKQFRPDVVTLDNEMPGETGIQFLERLIPENPIPVIIVTATPMDAFKATNAGAVEFVKKGSGSEYAAFINEISQKIKIASVSSVRRLQNRPKPTSVPMNIIRPDSRKVIAIGASTGGTEAILEVVKDLPANTPGIVIVQHMPPVFTNMYAERLNKICKMSAKEAQDGDRIKQGQIIVAAGEFHLTVKKDANGYFIRSQRGEKVSGHCPSVDVMFDSVADVIGKDAIGVILTGMGQDGAKGLLKMRNAGAYTIGQDKDTCVVYGMPMVAYNIGGVIKQLPLDQIDEEIIRFLNNGR